MAFDAHTNLAVSTIATAPSPATSGTTLTVAAGEGARFPVAPFNATVWPATAIPTPVNAEVVRVTARTGDVLTITRAQEGTTARSIIAGDLIAETITAKALTDLESGTNFPLITTPGLVRSSGVALTIPSAGLAMQTNDGADTGFLQISGGGFPTADRGAYINLSGNEASVPGIVHLAAGAAGVIDLYTGPATALRGRVHASGGLSWGGPQDPGAPGNIVCGAGGAIPGQAFAQIIPGGNNVGSAGTGVAYVMSFYNANGGVGNVVTSGTTTTYNTTSDARLKQDRGLLADTVLRQTRVHTFTWIADGEPGRGVLAQEAITVAPFAVSVGTDERDESGRLVHPWGVDYSKYVPDLIVGWQQHDTRIGALFGDQLLAAERLTALEKRLSIPQPMLLQRVRDWMDRIRAWLFPKDPSWIG